MASRITLLLIFFICCIAEHGFSQTQNMQAEFFFDTNSSTLAPDEQLKLKKMIARTDTVQVSGLSISAWCDDVGHIAYNERLSEKRAEAIKQLLVALSVPETMIDAKGNGEIALTSGESIEQTRAHNRRADVSISYTIRQAQQENTVDVPKEKPIEKKDSPLSDDQKVGDKITLQNILFIGGRHVLLPESYAALEKLTATLLEKTKYHIIILGHICCVQSGNDGLDFDTGLYNLSVARAQVIYDYLIKHGVAANRLEYKGLKHDYPTGLGDKQDRRVEIQITKIVSD